MGFSRNDTIVAIATPPGRGGIGVVRISGADAQTVAGCLIARRKPLEPRRATFTTVRLTREGTVRLKPDTTHAGPADVASGFSQSHFSEAIDHVVATYFPAPHSYTGEDVVELSAHGSPVVLRAMVAAAICAGARLAEPGEFTLRAFLNQRIDLPQAEAVADLIDAVTPLQARSAFDQLQGTLTQAIGAVDAALFDLVARLEASVDFPEEGYHFINPDAVASAIDRLLEQTTQLLGEGCRGRVIRDGLQVAIVGKPNVGKSSLFNALVGAERAIVTDVPGTTRDLVSEYVDLAGLRAMLVDTAGLRSTNEPVESEGVARARQAHAVADLTLVVLDRSRPRDGADLDVINQTIDNKRLIVINKIDLPAAWPECELPSAHLVSAATGSGLAELRHRVAASLDVDLLADRPAITNIRHIALVQRAHDALTRARNAALAEGGALSEEFVLADLQDARAALEEISGHRTSEDVLAHIFSRFCVGK